MKKPTVDCCVAYYIYNAYEHLTGYDCDGKKLTSQMVESPPTQCVVLSNGVVAMTSETAMYGNIVLETINKTGEKQIISLPQKEQTDEKFILFEFPKNHVCVYRHDRLFFFDPLNPFTTHKSVKVDSSAFQQLDGKLYLWNLDNWRVYDGVTLPSVWNTMSNDCPWPIQGTPEWVSPTQFVHYSYANGIRTVCLYDTTTKVCRPFPLKNFNETKRLGEVWFVVSGCRVLITQWPGWDEQSTFVKLTVFCTQTFEAIYENENWFDNRRVGLAPMKTIVGGFQWPFLQKNMPDEIQMYNLETNQLLCACETTCLSPVQTTFIGLLAIVQSQNEYDVLRLNKDTNRKLKFRSGQLFVHKFLDETIPIPTAPPLTIIVPEETAKDIVVDRSESRDEVRGEVEAPSSVQTLVVAATVTHTDIPNAPKEAKPETTIISVPPTEPTSSCTIC